MTALSLNSNLINTLPVADTQHCDVLIIGAGLAGLSTALSLPSSLKVIVLSKKQLTDCSSHYAQGGIAATLSPEDSVADHIQDTLIAGDGLCDKDNTTTILSDGAEAVAWLQDQGVPFTLTETANSHATKIQSQLDPARTTAKLTDLHLTREGGHGRRRVAHADDATGQHIMQSLHQRLQQANNIRVLTAVEAVQLLITELDTAAKVNDDSNATLINQCHGALVFDSGSNQLRAIESQAVVLASGGLGQLFKRATAPDLCMGDGMMMAWQAGCRLANLEFVQFHPTGLALDNSNFLISEAVRGEGGYLRCPITGERFMQHYDARLELAPRDIVARAIADQISRNGLGYVHLDISHQPADFIRQHFPQIATTLASLGIDMTCEPIPVAPTAHYTCGGVVATADGLTDVMGLYAAGEVAYTGLHGANRLASNSLLECVVVGRRIAKHLPHYLQARYSASWSTPQLDKVYHVDKDPQWPSDSGNSSSNSAMLLGAIHSAESTVYTSSTLSNNVEQVSALKELMSTHLGIIRDETQLKTALRQLQQWRAQANMDTTTQTPLLERLTHYRWLRLLDLATLMIQSALSRNESRGGHFRSDRSELSDCALVSIIDSPAQPIVHSSSSVAVFYAEATLSA